jgi:type II secretory pathway component PulJ
MNAMNCFPARSKALSSRAFTLIELLVSIAMVTLLILVVVSIMNSATSLITLDTKKMDADSEARAVFDRMTGDFAAMVKRTDVDYQFNNTTAAENGSANIFFYSEAPAISATAAPEDGTTSSLNSSSSLVGYRINASHQLERLGKGLQWVPNSSTSIDGSPDGMVYLTYASLPITSTSTPVAGTLATTFPTVLAAGSNDTNYHVIGDGVFRFTYWFLLKSFQAADGTYSPGIYSSVPYDARLQHTSLTGIGLQDVQAIVVSIGILDTASRKLLPSATSLDSLAGAFPDPTTASLLTGATGTPTWESIANAGTLAESAGIPRLVAAQVRVYQRTFNLTTPSNLWSNRPTAQ